MLNHYIIVESALVTKRKNERILPDKVIFDAVIQTANEKNRNGRVYKKEALIDALKAKMEFMDNNVRGFVGELDHPVITSNDKTLIDMRLANVLWERVSHVITRYWWENNVLWATIESTLTGKGPEIVKIVKDNIPLGFSMRAIATGTKVDSDGTIIVEGIDYLVAYDAVTTPSHNVATMRKLNEEVYYNLQESLNFTCCYDKKCLMENNNVKKNTGDVLKESYEQRLKRLFQLVDRWA